MSRVLIIEDEYALAAALSTLVRRLGAEPVVAASGQGGVEKFERHSFDAVLLDIGLPDMSGLKVLQILRQHAAPPPILIITAHGTLENALEARRMGAHDFFLKPLNLAEIQPCLKALLEKKDSTSSAPSSEPLPERVLMVGNSPVMQRAFALMAQASTADVPVLVTGPHGSGKSLAAQLIHRHDPRPNSRLEVLRADAWPLDHPLIRAAETDPAALASLESQLPGTLVIDEVGRLPMPLQTALAKWLDRHEPSAPRLIATTSQDLAALIHEGLFRQDLFYQLSVLSLSLPALIEHTEDIPALALYLLGKSAPEKGLLLAPETLALLKAYSWPGNVRELAAAMQHAAAVCNTASVLPRHLPAAIVSSSHEPGASHLDAMLERAIIAWLDQKTTGSEDSLPSYDDLLAHVEKAMLEQLLRHFDDKPTRLASALKMNRATLRRKLRELLDRE